MNQTTLGGRIKSNRKRLGLTQEQLAERMGVTAQAVSKWENDLSCPDISVLPELADVFGISVDELLGRADAAPVREAEPIDPPTEDGTTFSVNLPHKGREGLLFGLFILTVGALILVNALLSLPVSFWTVLWMCALIYLGVSGLFGGFSLFSLLLALGGLGCLLSAYDVIHLSFEWKYVLPVLLLLWGVSLLFHVFFGKKKHRRKHENAHRGRESVGEMSCEDGILHCEARFGSRRIPVVLPLLRGGEIEAGFGELTVDFSACGAVAPDCRLSVESSFGMLRLLIPARFRVELSPNESFGTSQIKGAPAENPEATIRIDAEVSFGTLEIQYI